MSKCTDTKLKFPIRPVLNCSVFIIIVRTYKVYFIIRVKLHQLLSDDRRNVFSFQYNIVLYYNESGK